MSISAIKQCRSIPPEAAQRMKDKVFACRDRWTQYAPGFFGTGPLAYKMDPWDYRRAVLDDDGRTAAYFADELAVVAQTIAGLAGKPVLLHPNAAPPGFHIFTDQAQGEASIHYDLPFQQVLWPEPFDQPFSFTMVLEQPAAGSGLNIWDNTLPVLAIGTEPDRIHRYEPGVLYYHSGMFTHQISHRFPIGEGEYRMTLQGHGARLILSDRVVIYL